MALERTSLMDIEEYFELEESNPDTRYEYLDGDVYMMSGGSANHATIGGNIYTILRSLLRGKPCRVYNSDMKVRVSETHYFRPDATITCDPRDRGMTDLIQSPRIVVKVFSISSEARDRGRKLQCYLACPTIEQYLLVDAHSMRIETYGKEQGRWIYDVLEADDEVELIPLGLEFPVADAYEDVMFSGEENDDESR